MLKINTEIRNGIFFIRFIGELTKENKDELDNIDFLIKDNGIENVVLNVSNINKLDDYVLNYIEKNCRKDWYICGLNKKICKSKLNEINNELSALNLIR
jgi:anti-anti-sigma regulatory factor